MTDSRKIAQNSDEHFALREALTPLARGISSGILCFLFSSTVRFRGGFVYGALSGVFDIATKLGTRGHGIESFPIEVKVLLYLATMPLPWIASAKSMHHMHARHAKYGHTLFKMTNSTAAGVAIFHELLHAPHHHLLKDRAEIKPKC